MLPGPHPQKACGDQVLGVVLIEFVARDLFEDEAVVRLVFVEAANDVIAITPGVRSFVIVRASGGVGVARDIQPVPSPAFAITRRLKQSLDDFLEGFRRRQWIAGKRRADRRSRGGSTSHDLPAARA
jgi:hypothetical protein